jgi:hypothetical protein
VKAIEIRHGQQGPLCRRSPPPALIRLRRHPLALTTRLPVASPNLGSPLAVSPALASEPAIVLEHLVLAIIPTARKARLAPVDRRHVQRDIGTWLSTTGTLVGLTALLDDVRGEDSDRMSGCSRAPPADLPPIWTGPHDRTLMRMLNLPLPTRMRGWLERPKSRPTCCVAAKQKGYRGKAPGHRPGR